MELSKKGQAQVENLLDGILGALDADVLVLRGKGCRVVYLNGWARRRIEQAKDVEGGYTALFPGLCERLMDDECEDAKGSRTFEVESVDGITFAVQAAKVEWVDEKPAVMVSLRDVSEERGVQQKLYNLAYIDQLTCIPNRQRFKEDFEAVAADIAAEKMCGVVTIFDLDNFKSINDTYGHNTGDVMLRRLAEHLNSDPRYRQHLYRLGGDEFVLFYTEPVGKFKSKKALEAYYGNLLSGAFVSYTMPNIEDGCTISRGVVPFPAYGTTSSELLRKADIALYKAKEGGRNKLVFFEDQYDSAKKFKDLYINIQPILTGAGTTWGYELIDRGNEGREGGDALNLSEFDRTIDALGLGDMQSDAHYFIAFTNQLLTATVLNNLKKDKFIVQIYEGEKLNPQLLPKYRNLKHNGFALALVDVPVGGASPVLMGLVDYVKFAPDVPDAECRRQVAANPGKRFIATRVDSAEQFEEAKRAGFKLFQGFFFNQPVVVKKTKDIDPMKANYLRLLKLTSTDDYVNFVEISTIISSDVALSYKLLRLLNSAAVGLRNPVSSIDMALAYLGEANLKQWIAMLALRGVAGNKPLELVRISLIRARFGELLAPHFVPKRDMRRIFLTGLFSLLHIALEKSKEEVLEEIPVADEIRLSLLTKDGPNSDIVAFFSDYEYANWDEVSAFARKNKLSDTLINDSYISAVKWYNGLVDT